ncbi:MAG: HAD-IB family phosphatase [Thermoplasmatota archaeon]
MDARGPPVTLEDGWLQVLTPRGEDPRRDVHRHARGLDLVIFDMDGTLVDKMSSWEMIHAAFGVSNFKNWQRYQRGEIDDHQFMASDIEMWCIDDRKVHVAEIEKILATAEIMPGARELVDALRAQGVATCILSGGLDLLARRVAIELGIDMYVANGLALTATGHLAGHGICYVKINDKGHPTRELLNVLGVAPARAAAVGNSEWDAAMFRECGFSVAVNPFDDKVRAAASVVLESKDLALAIPHLVRASGSRA